MFEYFKNLGQKWAKNGQNMVKIQKIHCHHFSGSKLHNKMLLSVFTRLVPEIQILVHFQLKSSFLGPNFNRTEIFTAKPMVVGCVQHCSANIVKKLGKSLESFFRKVQKIAKNGKKCQTGQKWAQNGQISKQKFHSFSGTKLPKKMAQAFFTRLVLNI